MLVKKKYLISILAIMLSIFTLFLFSSCSLFSKKLSDVLPEENVVSIERVTIDISSGEETRVTLSADKLDTFIDILGVLEYVKDYNIRGAKCIPFDEVQYLITYETYKVELREHYFTVYKEGKWQSSIRIKSIEPMGKYNSLNALFDE